MKKLSEFEDRKAAVVVAKLMAPIWGILQNAANAKAAVDTDPIAFISSILENSPEQTLSIMAILSEVDPAEYHTNGAELLGNIALLASDTELLALFGLRRQTEPSSPSA